MHFSRIIEIYFIFFIYFTIYTYQGKHFIKFLLMLDIFMGFWLYSQSALFRILKATFIYVFIYLFIHLSIYKGLQIYYYYFFFFFQTSFVRKNLQWVERKCSQMVPFSVTGHTYKISIKHWMGYQNEVPRFAEQSRTTTSTILSSFTTYMKLESSH